MRDWIWILAVCISWAPPAAAWDKRATNMSGNAGQTCAMQENAQVGVNFSNVVVTDLKKVGSEMDRKIDELIALAKQSGLQKIEVQSYSYNIYAVSSGVPMPAGVPIPYQYSGNVSFAVEPCEKASGLMSLLADKGYSASLNVNAYRQCQ